MAKSDEKTNEIGTDRLTLSVPEAGRLLGIGKNASYEAAARGDIPVIRIGGRLLVPRRGLQHLLDQASFGDSKPIA